MRDLRAGFSLYPAEELRIAALPLFEAGVIDALEWTVDVAFGWDEPLPEWTTALLDEYAAADRLYGHGVCLSPTTAQFDDHARAWLAELARVDFGSRRVEDRRRYRHVTEHWGFSRARGLLRGAPLPLVATAAVVDATVHALRELAAVVNAPVGLENLALALAPAELATQPAMIARVLDAVDGVLLFDLHNLWCQAVNFDCDVRELASRYPLARVGQIHVAGGGWSDSKFGKPMRRDTHDGWVPPEVLELVAWMIPRCPALEVVVLERLPSALVDPSTHDRWRAEWHTLAEVVRDAARAPVVAMPEAVHAELPVHDRADLARQQDATIQTLLAHRKGDAREAHAALLADRDLGPFRDEVASWDLRALEVALALVDKWSIVA